MAKEKVRDLAAYRCTLPNCKTPDRLYSEAGHLVRHLMGAKGGHHLKKREARRVLLALQQAGAGALVLPANALPRVIDRPVPIEQRLRGKITEMTRLREEIEADIDREQRETAARGRFLTRVRRMLDSM